MVHHVRGITGAVIAIAILTASVGAQQQAPADSPFAGVWVGNVPVPGGRPVAVLIALTVSREQVTGTLKIGNTEAVEIEDGRIRGDVLSFRRTLSDDGSRIQFLARIIDDGLRVGFMQRPPADAPAGGGSGQVVNFTAKRLRGH